MERLSFAADVAFVPRGDLLEGVTVAPLSAPMAQGAPFQAAIFRFAPGGRIARHPATDPQILAVLEGSGEVSGANGVTEPVGAGDAVYWAAGEEHEATSKGGLTALIVEGEGLAPFERREP